MAVILIAGSRHATQAAQDYAAACAYKWVNDGHSLIAGDAQGIDLVIADTVRQHCPSMDVTLTIYGIQPAPRFAKLAWHINYYNVKDFTNFEITVTDYRTRDKLLVQMAEKVMCIWNSESKGTFAVYQYAVSLGKEAYLKTFPKSSEADIQQAQG